MSYIIRANGRDKEYVVDIGAPEKSVTWARKQSKAKRFNSPEDAMAHVLSGFVDCHERKGRALEWMRQHARILRLIPRKVPK